MDADSVDRYTLTLRVTRRSFDAALPESAFEQREAGWVVLGRQGQASPAAAIARRGWHGVWGTATIGCYRVGGNYVGLCAAPTALVGTDTHSVILEGGPRSENIVDRVLETLELYP